MALRRQFLLVIGFLGVLISSGGSHAQSPAQAVATEAGKAVAKVAVGVIGKNILGDACTRHIYNKTKSDWIVTGSRGSGICEDGCLIKARIAKNQWTSIPINYPGSAMSITITRPDGRKDGFTVTGSGNCVYIQHNGKTDPIFLNDPANGDIIFDFFEP